VPAKKPWPPETIARLRELWKANVSATRIGAELGFTKNAIIGKARREGLSPRDTRFAAEIAIKVETEEDRQTIRRLWPTHSVTYIKTVTGIGWRRVMRIAASLDLPPKATLIIEKNKASPPRGARVSGAQQKRTSPVQRAATTSAASPSARGGRVPFPPPDPDLPGVAPETLQQRRVFSGKQCKMVVSGDDEPLRFCSEPVIASAKGQHCASPYCLAHYAAAYIGTNKDLGEPNKLRWRA
jgi:GcrA cell cycle regulator